MKYLFIVIMILFISCQKMRYGNVTKVWHEPEQEYTMLMPISTGKTIVLIPYFVHDNEDWCIEVSGVGTKGDSITRTFYVTKEQFDTIFVGKFICVDGKCTEDTNNIKTKK